MHDWHSVAANVQRRMTGAESGQVSHIAVDLPGPRPHSTRIQAVLATLLYFAFAVFVTWPFVLHPQTTLYGIPGADLTSSVAKFQELADAHHLPFLPGRLPNVDAPFGLAVPWTLDLASFPSSLLLWVFAVAFGSVAAHGIFVLFGFTATAAAMFLLVRRTTGNVGAALAAGAAFGFWPFTYEYGWGSNQYMHGWIFVLIFWRMLVALEQPTKRNGVVLGLAVLLAMLWTQYFLLIGAVFALTLGVIATGLSAARGNVKAQLRTQAVAVACVLAPLAVIAGLAATAEFSGVRKNPPGDVVAYSARPPMYLVPGPRNPLVGSHTGAWLKRRYVGPQIKASSTAAYSDVYLGWTTLALAVLGLGASAGLRRTRLSGESGGSRSFATVALMAGASVVVAGLFSGPPEVSVAGVTLPLPNDVVSHFTTTFRVASRFAIVVMLGVCVLAGLGFAALTNSRRRAWQIALSVVAVAVLVTDLWARPDPGTTRVRFPAVYHTLAKLPRGILAEYPLQTGINSTSEYTYNQQAHHQPLFNGFTANTESESRKMELASLTGRGVVPGLSRLGVRYVLVRPIIDPVAGYPKPGQRIPGLKKIAQDRYATLYRVVARPAREQVVAIRGFHLPEGTPPNFVRGVRENGAELEVEASCDVCRGVVSFRAASFAQPRVLTIRDPAGRVLARASVGLSFRSVRVPVQFSRKLVLELSTQPGPESIQAVLGGQDTRRLSLQIGGPARFSRKPGG